MRNGQTGQPTQGHLFPVHGHASTPSRSASRRQPSAAGPVARSRTTAQGVVAALALPASPPASSQPVRRPLPLTSLHQLPRDTSMLYDISRIDASGRVASLNLVTALGWQPRDQLDLVLTGGAIVLRASAIGIFCVQQCLRIAIPAAARRRHAIRTGDYVLLAAAPEYDTLIVYPLSALNDMIAHYHSVAHADEQHQHE